MAALPGRSDVLPRFVRVLAPMLLLPLAAPPAAAQEVRRNADPPSIAAAVADTLALPLPEVKPEAAPAPVAMPGWTQVPLARLDVSLSAGVTSSSTWLTEREGMLAARDRGPGTSLVVAADARYWLSPGVGVRLGASYYTGEIGYWTTAFSSTGFRVVEGELRVRGVSYDAGLVLRPFVWSYTPALSSAYVFAGAGGLSLRVTGDTVPVPPGGDSSCVGAYQRDGVCQARRKTVLQGTVGVGTDLVALTPSVGLYAEAAVTLYDPPVRELRLTDGIVGLPGRSSRLSSSALAAAGVAGTGTAATGRLTVGVRVSFGQILPPPGGDTSAPPPPVPADTQAYEGPGLVRVTSDPRGAEVYIVRAMIATETLLCSLTPSNATHFRRYTSDRPIELSGDEQPHIVVVRLGNREYREPFSMIRDRIVTVHYRMANAPLRNCQP